ncbi:MAG: hypothetical protein RIS76_393 [Verrucomicrobiota bacterium]
MLDPLPHDAWNRTTAAHLLNRAGFGGTPADVDSLARLTPDAAVTRLMNGDGSPPPELKPSWAHPDPDRAEKLKAIRTADAGERARLQKERNRERRRQMLELQQDWLRRMANGSRPLQEKMTLFWHGHFATSVLKVRDPYLMWRQNDLFRRRGAGSWRELLDAVTRDPAMLLWLDQAQSKPEHPNENYARELLELFTLGEGHYTERDVTEAARALCGLTLDRLTQEPVFRKRLQVAGDKTFLGRTGPLGIDDVLDQIAAQPQTDRFITGRLWTFFAGTPPSPALHDALAVRFRAAGQQFSPFLRTMLISEEFHQPSVMNQQIKSPVQLMVSACRQLERPLPPAPVCANTLRLLGQELFNPPNVKGWEGGLAWINTNTLLNRHNLALLLVTGENPMSLAADAKPASPKGPLRQRLLSRTGGGANPEKLFTPTERGDARSLLAAVERRFLTTPLQPREQVLLSEYLRAQGTLDDRDVLGVVRLALCTPQYQIN